MERAERHRVVCEIRELLMGWDAIGIADEPSAADEYDCLIGPILDRLRRGDDPDALRAWLARERDHHFGLDPDPAADMALADALVGWRRRPENHGV